MAQRSVIYHKLLNGKPLHPSAYVFGGLSSTTELLPGVKMLYAIIPVSNHDNQIYRKTTFFLSNGNHLYKSHRNWLDNRRPRHYTFELFWVIINVPFDTALRETECGYQGMMKHACEENSFVCNRRTSGKLSNTKGIHGEC